MKTQKLAIQPATSKSTKNTEQGIGTQPSTSQSKLPKIQEPIGLLKTLKSADTESQTYQPPTEIRKIGVQSTNYTFPKYTGIPSLQETPTKKTNLENETISAADTDTLEQAQTVRKKEIKTENPKKQTLKIQ